MRARSVLIVSTLCAVLGAASRIDAGTTGKIAGRVRAAAGREAITAASILVEGTRLGAVSDENGQFFILNLPPGEYTLVSHAMGFRDVSLAGVHVTADFTTSVEFTMEAVVAATTPTVKVEGRRALIQADATSTVRIVDEEEIRHSPTRGYLGIVAQHTGVVNFTGYNSPLVGPTERSNNPILIFRGGRPDEVGYYVDGFSQQDLQTGLTTATVPNASLSEIVILPGGFSAEYGRNLSGVVNIVTKEGGNRLSGSFEAITDNVAGEWIGAHSYDQNVYSASLGGPLTRGAGGWRFHVAAERGWSGDQSPSAIGFDEGRLPSNSNGSWLWNGKVSGKVAPRLELKVGSTGSLQDWLEYRNPYRFDLDHVPRYRDTNYSAYAQLGHTLSSRAVQSLAVGYFRTERKRGDAALFDDVDAYGYYGGSGNPTFDPDEGLFVYGTEDPSGAHIYNNMLHRQSQYVELKWSLTYQHDYHNLLKFGIDAQRHSLRFFEHLNPTAVYPGNPVPYVDVQSYGYESTGTGGIVEDGLNATKHPVSIGAYLQDKIEYEGIIIQPGLRYDYFDSKTPRIADEANPLDESSQLTPERLVDSEPKHTISPRLGVAFPIDARTHFHLNFGKFYQQPNLEELYTNYSYIAYKIRTGGYYYPFGNPNLEPEETVAYEVGVTRQLSGTAKLEVSAYYKDIEGLTQVTTIPSSPNSFASFQNRDYGTAKGIDFYLMTERVRRLAGSVSYSLSYAEGTGSISNSQRNIAWTGSEPPKQTAPLAFDQRHRLTVGLDYRYADGDGPALFGMKPFSKSGLNVLLQAGSGFPYTPTQVYNAVTLQSVASVPVGPINSRYGPWTWQVDMKLDRDFRVGTTNLNAFLWVVNVFDRENAVTVYSTTGLPDETGWLSTPDGQAWLEANGEGARERYEQAQRDPRNFGPPRIVRFGLRTSF
jgi:outer membrane receptor protein involved in Fe transport